jgi:predicted ester cyclase
MDDDSAAILVGRIFTDVVDGGRYDAFEELFDPEFVDHTRMGDVQGRAGFEQFVEGFRQAFGGQLRHEVSDVRVIGDDFALWRVRFTGRFSGSLAGVTGDGRPVDVWVANAGRLRNGRAVEHWGLGPESAGELFEQMGIPLAALAPTS